MRKRFFGRWPYRNPEMQSPPRHTFAAVATRRGDEETLTAGKRFQPDDRLARELLARLLLELPEHRRALLAAFERNEHRRLRDCTHKLLGAAVYCDLPQLSADLRVLREACGDGERERIRAVLHRAIRTLDEVLSGSGCTLGQ